MKRLLASLLLVATLLSPGCSTIIRPLVRAVSQSSKPALVTVDWMMIEAAIYAQTGVEPVPNQGAIDSLFYCPTHSELDDMDFYVRNRQHLLYIPEAWDCDDLAKEWCVLAHRWSVENITKREPASLAAFVIGVAIHPGAFDNRWHAEGLHALGLIIDSDGVAYYVDAQTGWHVSVEEARFDGTIEALWIFW